MNPYSDLTRKQLEERLTLAEDVCRMYGWSAGFAETDREKAAYMLWVKWHNVAGPRATEPARYPHLNDKAVARMAAGRDDIRARTLARIAGVSA